MPSRGRLRDPYSLDARVQAGAVEGFRAQRPSTAADARAIFVLAQAASAPAREACLAAPLEWTRNKSTNPHGLRSAVDTHTALYAYRHRYAHIRMIRCAAF